MDFTVIDVETANPNLASICQVGVAVFRSGKLHESWSSLVNPNDYFHHINVSVHGIDESMVLSAPSWAEVYHQILPFVTGQIVASHMPFDRTATLRACHSAGLEHFDCTWLDTARVARRAWSEFSRFGYGLKNLAANFGISFEHHDAAEDARAAGEILLRAVADTGSTPAEWCSLVQLPLSPLAKLTETAIDQDGVLGGNFVVFTGALSIPRREASQMAAAGGCEVGNTVTKQTTLLVVGDQDISRLAGKDKSSKHVKAEELIAKGQKIRILGESDFQALLQSV
ncbi:exonuclease domain-containing protein [Pseudomonas sp. FP2338]|uniref:exonuclease domain-containing protein n=1 Tax=Pseudomonas sp. FP2338 TaxID=2954093 RepID=UPI0027323F46|nr:exonuclease domain-containing protein [Pseudomonas sp. FP2338]WLH83975.1 exonuclease domain-containing protein [Pseudomonas sp. FP2338]